MKVRSNSLLARGEPFVWLTGGALIVAVVMIVGLMSFIVVQGLRTFWPGPLVQLRTFDGKTYLGEVKRIDDYRPEESVLKNLPESARQQIEKTKGLVRRRQLRTENFELTKTHEYWISDFQIVEETLPDWALVLERTKGGNFYGTPAAFVVDGKVEATQPAEVWAKFNENTPAVRERLERIKGIKHAIGEVSNRQTDARIEARKAQLRLADAERENGENGASAEEIERIKTILAAAEKSEKAVKESVMEETERLKNDIAAIERENDRLVMRMVTADGQEADLLLATIVRAYPANRLSFTDKLGIYFFRWGEFLADEPREANTEGGVFPAIWGTVAMTLMLALFVVPFGVLAALYLREYAKSGPIIVAVRIAINNLAGVPSIVYGVFGMGFFCYLLGAFVDGGPERIQVAAWPPARWMLMLGVVIAIGVAAFCAGIGGVWTGKKKGLLGGVLGRGALLLWMATIVMVVLLIGKSPFFQGFYRAQAAEGQPVFASGGLLWASLTLALLTLPVVIVATEEALSAVPNSMREGSYACGASKWQTIRRIVLPRALPGIMTGMILAMARGAGEVAPLMLVGAIPFAPSLPVDDVAPFVHPSRRFMHLGLQIFYNAFQSPNSEAARPMLFTTTLLLIAIVVVLNLLAVWLRARLRRRFLVSQF